MNIKYIHLPELGIDSEKRRDLQGVADYNRLFKEYETSILLPAEKSSNEILEKLRIYKRVALMCFEKEAVMCHRGRIVNHLNKLLEGTIPIKNL